MKSRKNASKLDSGSATLNKAWDLPVNSVTKDNDCEGDLLCQDNFGVQAGFGEGSEEWGVCVGVRPGRGCLPQ